MRELVHFYTIYGSCKKLRLSIFKRIWQLQKLGQLESWAGVFLSQLRSWELQILNVHGSCDWNAGELRLKFDSWPYIKFLKSQILRAGQGI